MEDETTAKMIKPKREDVALTPWKKERVKRSLEVFARYVKINPR